MWEVYSFKCSNNIEQLLGKEPDCLIVKRDKNGKIITGYLLKEDTKNVVEWLEKENVVYCGTMKTI